MCRGVHVPCTCRRVSAHPLRAVGGVCKGVRGGGVSWGVGGGGAYMVPPPTPPENHNRDCPGLTYIHVYTGKRKPEMIKVKCHGMSLIECINLP